MRARRVRRESTVSVDAFKSAMRCFPTGVTVITTFVAGRAHGFTANAFTSLSVEPPSVLICVHHGARSHLLITESERFCVNILRAEQRSIADHFSESGDDKQFDGVPYARDPDGAPQLVGSLAWFDCAVSEAQTVATHTIFIGIVLRCESDPTGKPLGYLHGRFQE
jgi:flavin reductase (DIM6/NTAB) family NADH-FMN oxidoreductase RutF